VAFDERPVRALAVFIEVLVTARAVDFYHICIGVTVDVQTGDPFAVRCILEASFIKYISRFGLARRPSSIKRGNQALINRLIDLETYSQ
jgi:hypothetical protein